ncbi:MAG: DUF3047 domain-containing protein [Nitrospirota bacterium]
MDGRSEEKGQGRILPALTRELIRSAGFFSSMGMKGLLNSCLSCIVLLALLISTSASGDSPFFEEGFSNEANKDGTPKGWKLKSWLGSGYDIRLENEAGNYYLHMASDKNSFGIYKEVKFDIKDYPILKWRWKVTILPNGGDVRNKETDDQAAQVYVVFPRFPAAINSRQVGYIWEDLTPGGIKVQSKKTSNTRYIVLKNRKDRLGEWFSEKRNVYEDYKELFGEEPPPVGGIMLMIDSDDTRSRAESYFDDISFGKE